jgi:hypothetical protein
MSTVSKLGAVTFAAAFLVQSTFAIAGPVARIIPTGTVSTLMDGRKVDQFKSETIMPQDTMMLCDGTCLVQMHNLQVVAKDKAVFALAETSERWNLTIKSGQVDFAMGPQAKLIDFRTPHESIVSQEILIPASTESRVVRGSIIVTEGSTELIIHQGAMRVAGSNGSQLIQSGHSIVLTQARQTKEPVVAAAGTGDGAGAAAGAGGQSMMGTAIFGAAHASLVAGVIVNDKINENERDKKEKKVKPISKF